MLSQVLPSTSIEATPNYVPQCGQCRYFVPARERISSVFGLQVRPSYCQLLAAADCDNTRKAFFDSVCRQYGEFTPF